MKKLALISLYFGVFCFSILANEQIEAQFINCHEDSIEVLNNDLQLAYELFNQVHQDILKADFPDQFQQKEVINTANCILEKLNQIPTFQCLPETDYNCSLGANAYVLKKVPILDTFFLDRDLDYIYLCPNYQLTSQTNFYRSSVMIHEISHLCGTKDYYYFSFETETFNIPTHGHRYRSGRNFRGYLKKRIDKFPIWQKNADMYEYWTRFGFCIPGDDCLVL